jgi:hypothetical protein
LSPPSAKVQSPSPVILPAAALSVLVMTGPRKVQVSPSSAEVAIAIALWVRPLS